MQTKKQKNAKSYELTDNELQVIEQEKVFF